METVKTYGTNYEEIFDKKLQRITQEHHDDQLLVESIKEKMGVDFVFSVGFSSFLYKGFIRKLNRDDYSLVLRQTDEGFSVPFSFAKEYLDTDLCLKENDYVSLSEIAELSEKKVEFFPDEKIVILCNRSRTPAEVYNTAERKRLFGFFNDPLSPEPTVNAEQTRLSIAEAFYPDDAADWRETEYTTLYSPAITVMTVKGEKTIFAAHEYSKLKNWRELDTVTVLRKSLDNGKTWSELSRVPKMRWGSMFVHDGSLYICGTNIDTDGIMFVRFNESGTDYELSEYDFGSGETAPNSVLEAYGRVFIALGKAVISADCGSDLLKFESWTVSSPVADMLSREWFLKASGVEQASRFRTLEGNMVLGKDGKIYDILRCESQPNSGFAAVAELSRDGKTASIVESCNSLIRMPTSVSKFVIRYDDVSGKYISLPSINTIKGFADQRSVLGLVSSDDLFNWKFNEYILSDREMMNPVCSAYKHAFQYVDFVIDGDDIIMLIRESTGRTNIWHDGNHITFYRIRNFRKYL
ncbi:MAG: hypothetical protein J5850_00305 [Clostridia bacterium]|nr:hypothetical protein [Clostridia bacterium]